MKKTSRFFSLLIVVFMLVQMMSFSAFAQSFEAYWGQAFPDEEWWFNIGEAVFWHRADITNFEFKLYKDNVEVYSERIEEGSWGDATEGDWYNETLFLPQFSVYGNGTYYFTVSSLTNDNYYIDDETIVQTAKSGNFSYKKPSTSVSMPRIVSNKDGVFDWEKTDDNTYAYVYDLEVDYGNGVVYDPDYVETYCWDDFESEYDIENLRSALEYADANFNNRYPIENAKVKIRVRSMPEDITEYNPSAYTSWYTIDYEFAPGGDTPEEKPEEKPLDRTVVSDKYYRAAKVAYDLGIIDDVYDNYNKNVTRADLAEIFVKMMGMEDAAADYNNRNQFDDVETGTKECGYINLICNYRMMSGTAAKTFSPDTDATYISIVKPIVSALGYEIMAQQYGGYPSGYLYVAMSKGVSDGVAVANDGPVTKEQLAQIVYNSLNIGIMKQTSWGTNETYEVTKDTLLYQLGITRFIGEVDCINNQTASVNGFAFNKSNYDGVQYSEKAAVVSDADILTYSNKSMELYMMGNEILCGFEYAEHARDDVDYKGIVQWKAYDDMVVHIMPVEPVADAVLYVAFYNSSGKVIDIVAVPDFEASNKIPVPKNARRAKAFVLDGARPLMQVVAVKKP